MSLGNCPECWDTPCTCGHMYSSWSYSELKQLVKVINKELLSRKKLKVLGKNKKVRPKK